jgi:hypothetical protein
LCKEKDIPDFGMGNLDFGFWILDWEFGFWKGLPTEDYFCPRMKNLLLTTGLFVLVIIGFYLGKHFYLKPKKHHR